MLRFSGDSCLARSIIALALGRTAMAVHIPGITRTQNEAVPSESIRLTCYVEKFESDVFCRTGSFVWQELENPLRLVRSLRPSGTSTQCLTARY